MSEGEAFGTDTDANGLGLNRLQHGPESNKLIIKGKHGAT